MKLVFCGTGAFGIPALRALVAAGLAPSLVVSQPDRPQGRHGTPSPPPFAAAAAELGLPLYQPERVNRPEALERLASEHCDVMIVAAYGQILKKALLDLPPLGCINLHGSLLPRHRGASPVQGALLAGDALSGTTVMLMDEGLDTGAVLSARSTPIGEHETAGELHDRLAQLGAELVVPALQGLSTGSLHATPQDAALATHCGLIDKREGQLDWALDAVVLDRRIRAFTPWPGAWSYVPEERGPLRLGVARARPTTGNGAPGTVLCADDSGLVVACGVGALLIEHVQPAGKKVMPAAAWLRGYALPRGCVLLSQSKLEP